MKILDESRDDNEDGKVGVDEDATGDLEAAEPAVEQGGDGGHQQHDAQVVHLLEHVRNKFGKMKQKLMVRRRRRRRGVRSRKSRRSGEEEE